jgi:tRNA threonylcarbamoyladenosine biosynthesis protein TsaE
LDLFRLGNPQDILRLGYEEYLYNQGICVIEWAERLAQLLPDEFLKIELKIAGQTKRIIRLTANGRQYHKILKGIR